MLEIQDGIQITESSNGFAGFTDTHVVPKTIQGFATMYETSKHPQILADAASCLENARLQPTNRKYYDVIKIATANLCAFDHGKPALEMSSAYRVHA